MLQKYVPFPPGNQAGIFIRGGCENLRMHGSQLLLWAASQFFFQNVDL